MTQNGSKWPKNDISEMSRFTRFARHKFSADRHLKLFCTPGLGWPDWPEWPDQPFPWDGIQEGQWENHCHAQCSAPMTWHVPYMPIYAHLRGQKFIGNNLISANEDQVQRGNSLQSLGENFDSSFKKYFKVKNSVWSCISQLTVPVRSSWPNIWFKITHPTLPIIL